ncbi:MAG: hypothetical protein J6X72_01995, partial [Clostridia bacterium]|nr:hypothetical protein [Clostridia bacterium]
VAQMEAALGDKHEAILDAMANLRIIVDKIESIVPDEKWPLPKYFHISMAYNPVFVYNKKRVIM